MESIKNLAPKEVFSIFDQITKIPRPSKHEEQFRAFLIKWAADNKLDLKEDAKGNIVIRKAATKGYENQGTIVLQSHMDMVCEKEATSTHDFMKDPIDTYLDQGWLKARGTTLGADCGIGMALQMAVLKATNIAHPAIEALFTVDEEQGLTGAMNLGLDMLTGKRMINLDSEEQGQIYIGCAGGVDTIATFELRVEKAPVGLTYYALSIDGLTGGHSGDDIEKGFASANKILARMLWEFLAHKGVVIARLSGGNLRNAIAREASAVIGVPSELCDTIKAQFADLTRDITSEFSITEPMMCFSLTPAQSEAQIIEPSLSFRVVAALLGVAHGVQSMSHKIEGLVETSTNLASIRMTESSIVVVTSQRSSVESAKHAIASMVESIFSLAGARVDHTDEYPGWEPNMSSPLLRVASRLYEQMYGESAQVKAIHAGLECGLFLTYYRDMDMISIGPTLRGVHSPSERLEVRTVGMVWDYLLALLSAGV
ncbi:MAG: aminoacyl-histidine dipeptidase [Mucinivorans sp.]